MPSSNDAVKPNPQVALVKGLRLQIDLTFHIPWQNLILGLVNTLCESIREKSWLHLQELGRIRIKTPEFLDYPKLPTNY